MTGQQTTTPTATPGGLHATVEVIGSIASGFQFSPTSITIKVGTTVRWINATAMPHTSTSDVGSTLRWDSLTINPEGTFSFIFTQVGTYHYHCAFHPTMAGTIVVTS